MRYSDSHAPSVTYEPLTSSSKQRSSSSPHTLSKALHATTASTVRDQAAASYTSLEDSDTVLTSAREISQSTKAGHNGAVEHVEALSATQTSIPISDTDDRAVRCVECSVRSSKVSHPWRRIVLKASIGVAAATFAGSVAFNVACSYFDLFLNVSESLPYGLYKVTYLNHTEAGAFGFGTADGASYASHDALERGQVVLMCLPEAMAHMAYKRDYIASGKCKGGVAPVGKHVIAMAGDRVKYTDVGVEVNGELVPDSAAYAADGAGRELPYLRTDEAVEVADGELVLLNSFAGSFDSRYFGAVHVTNVIGTLSPVFVFS